MGSKRFLGDGIGATSPPYVHARQLEETGQLPLPWQVSLNRDGLPLQALT